MNLPCKLIAILLLGFLPLCVSARKKQRMPDYLTTSPFPWKAYQNSGRFYRCVGYIKTTDMSTAHDKTLLDAKTRLSKAILNSFNDNADPGKDELLSIPLPDLRVLGETTAPAGAHLNMYWILIRVNRRQIRHKVLREYKARHEDDAEPRDFMAKFDEEMNSLKNYDY